MARKPNPAFTIIDAVAGLQQAGNSVKLYWGQKDVSLETVMIQGTNAIYGTQTSGIPMNGLMVYVNANENASYPGSGTTWYDLGPSGKNLTLDATPTFVTGSPNYFDFTDGTDGATYKPGGTLDSLTTQGDQYTVCLFGAYKGDQGSAAYRTVFRDVNGSTASDYVLVDRDTDVTDGLGTYLDGFDSFQDGGTDITLDIIPNYSSSFNFQVFTQDRGAAGNDVNFYLNDATGSATGSNDAALRYDGPAVFGATELGNNPGMKLSAILVYDRVISGEEMGQIYDALKDQMGL